MMTIYIWLTGKVEDIEAVSILNSPTTIKKYAHNCGLVMILNYLRKC